MSEEQKDSGELEAAGAPAEGEGTERRHRKERSGVVIKASARKTVVVQVSRRVKHPLYGKYVTRRKRYAVHDEVGVSVGDFVRIQETRPLSKTKRWRIVGKTDKHF